MGKGENCLFVYGTLMPDRGGLLGRAERSRLVREARRLGPATIQGRLYCFGRYPGLSDSERSIDLVHGEALLLEAPHATFTWLDEYEGGDPAIEEVYQRVLRPIRLTTGEVRMSWVYLYARQLAAARLVASGRWRR